MAKPAPSRALRARDTPVPAPGARASASTASPTPRATDQPATAPAAAPRRRTRSRGSRLHQVTRVVRRVDTVSMFKISVLFFVTLYLVMVVAGVLLWALITSTGQLEKVENFIEEAFALDSFAFDGQQLFTGSLAFGAVLLVGGTALVVAATVFFNLFSQLTGGVRVTVLEEETQLVPPAD